MNYTLMPSLEHMAFIRIATTLWNQDDIGALTAKFYFRSLILSERRREWQTIEDEVIGKVPGLLLPESMKKRALYFIKPIGLEILKWKEYHEDLLSDRRFVRKNLNRLCWTPQGTVDKKKTAEVLIKDENLDITKRYKLACIYCLENDILELWNKMPESRRKSFYNEEDPRYVNQQDLVVLWTYDIKGEVNKLDSMIERRWQSNCSPYQYAFEYAAVGGNKSAAEYFLQKLTPQERKESLVRSAGYVAKRRCTSGGNRTDFPKEHYADVLCFLLSQMDEEEQIEVFKSYPYEVLKCFLDWPWQSLFMETARRIWPFLSEEGYNLLLRLIVNKTIDGYKDYNYQKLFAMFWQQSPATHKRYVIDECSNGLLLSKMLSIEDEGNTRLILKDATLIEKKKLIFSSRGEDICQDLIYGNKWDFLEFFIRECIPSNDEMVKFREEFKECMTWCCSKEEFAKSKDKWDKFFELLDDLIEKGNRKRGMDGANSIPAKKLCGIEFGEITNGITK
ncbi:hypothetical protein [Wolbachia endosymbiont of Rhagoletis cingulata]|uniref:hypothetical protein n=1 Tax=Wolbachia endosymbiont of Rhagoletis cingulata TaxID=1220542 RepID=UPI003AF3C493